MMNKIVYVILAQGDVYNVYADKEKAEAIAGSLRATYGSPVRVVTRELVPA